MSDDLIRDALGPSHEDYCVAVPAVRRCVCGASEKREQHLEAALRLAMEQRDDNGSDAYGSHEQVAEEQDAAIARRLRGEDE